MRSVAWDSRFQKRPTRIPELSLELVGTNWLPGRSWWQTDIDKQTRRQSLVSTFMIERRQTDLLHIVAALHPSCGFPGTLYGWQKQAHEDADNGDHDKQFYERKRSVFCTPNTIQFHAMIPEL